MNPNTTAQRKTTKTSGKTNDRPRGAMAHILDSAKLVEAAREVLRAEGEYSPLLIAAIQEDHNDDHLLIAVGDNQAAVLNSEGVGTKEADGTVGVFVDVGFDRICVDVPVDKIAESMTCLTVDLAQAIRVFGARLDSNHFQWYSAYTGTYQP
jgi:hypothetical protein